MIVYKPLSCLPLHACSVTLRGSSDLWHIRLRHSSNLVVKNLFGQSTFSFSNNDVHVPCHVYLRAKQTRDSLPISLNNVDELFDLIHCDLWDP